MYCFVLRSQMQGCRDAAYCCPIIWKYIFHFIEHKFRIEYLETVPGYPLQYVIKRIQGKNLHRIILNAVSIFSKTHLQQEMKFCSTNIMQIHFFFKKKFSPGWMDGCWLGLIGEAVGGFWGNLLGDGATGTAASMNYQCSITIWSTQKWSSHMKQKVRITSHMKHKKI